MSQAPKGQERPPVPAGNHLGICVRIYDLGTQKEDYQGKVKMNRKLRFGFETPDETFVFDEKKGEQPFLIDTTFNFFFSEKSNFVKAMTSWMGGDLDPDFDIEDRLGKPAFINVIHENKNGKVYANIETIAPVPKAMLKSVPKPVNKLVYWSVEEGKDSEGYKNLPDFLKKIADSCMEWNTETPDDAAANQSTENSGDPDWN